MINVDSIVLPGERIPAWIERQPRAGGISTKVFDLSLIRFMNVLFQPMSQFMFNAEQGGALVKRLMCFADWPENMIDPLPIHSQDVLVIPLQPPYVDTQPISVVQASPTPTTTSFAVAQGMGMWYLRYQHIAVGTVTNAFLQGISGDVLTLAAPLPAAPAVGATVQQVAARYAIVDSDPFPGHALQIYISQEPQNL